MGRDGRVAWDGSCLLPQLQHALLDVCRLYPDPVQGDRCGNRRVRLTWLGMRNKKLSLRGGRIGVD